MLQNGHQIIVFLASIGAGGIAVSLVTKLLKKFAKGHLDQDIHKVVLALTGVAGYVQYVGQLHAVLPPYILGVSATSIYGASQLIYRGANTAINLLGKVQNQNDNPAAVPATSETPVAASAPTEASF